MADRARTENVPQNVVIRFLVQVTEQSARYNHQVIHTKATVAACWVVNLLTLTRLDFTYFSHLNIKAQTRHQPLLRYNNIQLA